MDWLSSLGNAAVSPANPIKSASTVNSDGTVTPGGTTTMSGFTIIEADSMEAALSIAKACPFLDIAGSLEVSELAEMPNQNKHNHRIHSVHRKRRLCLALLLATGDAEAFYGGADVGKNLIEIHCS
jgi:hypothetical protein